MGRPKKINNAVHLSVLLSKEQADRIKHVALKMSVQEGRQISVCEAIRMAIETVYPVPKQKGLFD